MRTACRPLLALCLALAACGDLPDDGADSGAPGDDAGGSAQEDGGEAPDAGSSSTDAGAPDAGPGTAQGTLFYPVGPLHSPVTAQVAAGLRAIAARGQRAADVVSRVGDSNTVNPGFLSCFAGNSVDLDGRAALSPALTHFRGGTVAGASALTRASLAAQVGWSVGGALAGSPTPLQQEVDAASPRFATVMFGTNDVGGADPYTYGKNLVTLVDTLTAQGVVPLVSSVPSRDDNATADAWVARYNLVARGVAQRRGVPFVDFHRALQPVPAHGLGPDGIHLNVFLQAGARGCVFTTTGLGFGHNVRNLLTLEALARAWDAVEGRPAPDDSAPLRPGAGTRADPLVVDGLPFVDVRDTRVDGEARLSSYPGCASAANEGGREVLYRVDLQQAATLRVFVVSLGGSDVDVHVLSSPDSGADCLMRNDRVVVRRFEAGTTWLSLDTYVSQGAAQAGEYVLVVLPE